MARAHGMDGIWHTGCMGCREARNRHGKAGKARNRRGKRQVKLFMAGLFTDEWEQY
jgi:hypothetical protein